LAQKLFPVFVAALAILAPVQAQADVFAWRDTSGRLVLSDRPAPAGARSRTFAVGSGEVRTTVRVPVDTSRAALRRRLHPHIEDVAARHALDPNLVRAVIQVESAWNPRAVSAKGAMGLMQLMPGTAAELGVTNPFNPEENIRGGVAYLKRLLDRFDGNAELALAAYNAGPGAVEKYGRRVPPYRETRQYVKKIKSVTEIRTGPNRKIYKIVELIDGREVPRYSDTKPEGDYELVTRR
jgi:soluble lytic murein transglycosylase-like protein